MNLERFNKYFIDSLNTPFNNLSTKDDPTFIRGISFLFTLFPFILFLYTMKILEDYSVLLIISFVEGVIVGMLLLYWIIKKRKQQIIIAAIIIMFLFFILLYGIFKNG